VIVTVPQHVLRPLQRRSGSRSRTAPGTRRFHWRFDIRTRRISSPWPPASCPRSATAGRASTSPTTSSTAARRRPGARSGERPTCWPSSASASASVTPTPSTPRSASPSSSSAA
jgi:hypothetical protein